MARITNQMIADEIKRRGLDPEEMSTVAIEMVWLDLREAAGIVERYNSLQSGGACKAKLSEERADKIYDLLIA